MARAYVHRNAQFPVLATFDSRIELYWIVSYGVNRDIVDDALEVEFVRGRVSRASPSMSPCPTGGNTRPWSSTWKIPEASRCTSACACTTAVTTATYTDRFNRNFDLAAGERRSCGFRSTTSGMGRDSRLMDMAHISDITLFRGEAAGLAAPAGPLHAAGVAHAR